MTAEELLKMGIDFLREDNRLGALSCFEKAYDLDKKRSDIQSYLGRCIAVERGQITEALTFCLNALEQDSENQVHYLNFGIVYLKDRRKDEGIETFRKGLSYGDNEEIHTVLDNLGIRKQPVFPFLRRKNMLNRVFGLLRTLLSPKTPL
jgi:tetratricopeptide (TPR) repeat protein